MTAIQDSLTWLKGIRLPLPILDIAVAVGGSLLTAVLLACALYIARVVLHCNGWWQYPDAHESALHHAGNGGLHTDAPPPTDRDA